MPGSRIFVECTHTFFAGGNNGIRRVARNLANCGAEISDGQVEVAPIVWGGIGFFRLRKRLTDAPHLLQRIREGIDRTIGMLYQATPPPLRRPLTWLKRLLAARMQPRVSSDLVFLLLGLTSFPLRFVFGKPVTFQPGDIVVLVDSTWNSKRMLDTLSRTRTETGLRLGAMVHDLFPLVMPETCHEQTIRNFTAWFAKVAPEVDFFVTNSQATRQTLDRYLEGHPEIRPYAWRIGSFPLGAELDQRARHQGRSDSANIIWDTPGRLILAVGTVEPRKNYGLLLDAFDLLYPKHAWISLMIVGRPGWKSEALLKRIKSHPVFGERLIHLDDASDSDLDQAFQRADCLVCPSMGEGFGLPVVEGLQHGLTVFASAIPPFLEIGEQVKGASCRYFPPDSPEELAGMIEDWLIGLQQDSRQTPRTKFDWPDWRESTRRFVRVVEEMAEAG